MKGVADRTLELMNEYQAHTKSYQSFQHFLVVKIEELEDEIEALRALFRPGDADALLADTKEQSNVR